MYLTVWFTVRITTCTVQKEDLLWHRPGKHEELLLGMWSPSLGLKLPVGHGGTARPSEQKWPVDKKKTTRGSETTFWTTQSRAVMGLLHADTCVSVAGDKQESTSICWLCHIQVYERCTLKADMNVLWSDRVQTTSKVKTGEPIVSAWYSVWANTLSN